MNDKKSVLGNIKRMVAKMQESGYGSPAQRKSFLKAVEDAKRKGLSKELKGLLEDSIG